MLTFRPLIKKYHNLGNKVKIFRQTILKQNNFRGFPNSCSENDLFSTSEMLEIKIKAIFFSYKIGTVSSNDIFANDKMQKQLFLVTSTQNTDFGIVPAQIELAKF